MQERMMVVEEKVGSGNLDSILRESMKRYENV
jgi:hypothetical protein